MIWESSYWKDDLRNLAAFLSRKQQQQRWTDASEAQVEKRVFLGAYAIRRLAESGKLTDRCRTMHLRVKAYPANGRTITRLNWHRSEEHFDLKKGTEQVIPLERLVNQFIHSFVFHLVRHRQHGGLVGFLVASVYQKRTSLLDLKAEELIRACRAVAMDHIVRAVRTVDPSTGKASEMLLGPEDVECGAPAAVE